MILATGIDIIEIKRFASWHIYSPKKLSRIFSPQEIEYCLENTHKSTERFAVRFAAREALYKALCAAFPDNKLPFLTLCAHTTIQKVNSVPVMQLSRECGIDVSQYIIHLSLSHSGAQAVAFVIIEDK